MLSTLVFQLDKAIPTAMRTSGRLTIDGTTISLSSGSLSTQNKRITWNNPGLSAWTDNQQVSVSLTAPATTVSLSVRPNPVREGTSLTVQATLGAPLASAVTIPLALKATPQSIAPAEPGDYGTLADIRIAAGQRAGTVTLSINEDDDADDEQFNVALGSPLPSLVGRPALESEAEVTVRITDDDMRGLTFPSTALTVPENGSASYTVKLATRPWETVTVTISGYSGTDVTVDTDPDTAGDQATLTFSTANWSKPRTVTVSAGDDGDSANDTVTLSHAASGGGYGSVSGNVRVTVNDDEAVNEAPTFTSPATLRADENRTPAGTVVAEDGDAGDSITGYAITGGVDASKFSITNTGVLTFKAAPDYENPQDAASADPASAAGDNEYVLVVTATGGTGGRALTANQTVTVRVYNMPEAPSRYPPIAGTPRVGETLAADIGAIDDPDGMSNPRWRFRWIRMDGLAGTRIPGATSRTYTPVPWDVGRRLTVEVTYTDDRGDTQTLIPAPTGEVAGVFRAPPVPSQPAGVTAQAGDRQVRLGWNAMDGVSVWQYERDGDGVWKEAGDGLATGHTVTGLANGAAYRFRVRAVNDAGTGPPSAPVSVTPGAGCEQRLAGDGSVTGRWAAGCDSAARAGRHARWYAFTLAERREVTLELRSGVDTYLYLRSGAGQRTGTPVAEDDDGGAGVNSRLVRTLDAGTYTIEATTHHRRETGDFTLTVSGTRGGGGAAPTTGEDPATPTDRTPTSGQDPAQPTPALRVGDAEVREPAPYYGPSLLRFTVTLAPAAAHMVRVDYETRDGTAVALWDYTPAVGMVTFGPGETSKTVSVRVLEDDDYREGRETLTLALSNASGATIADGRATGTIVNDGGRPRRDWLSRFGRAAAADAVAAVTGRLETPRDAGSHVTLGGQRLPLDGSGGGLPSAPAAGPGSASWLSWPDDPAGEDRSRTMSGRELLMGTSFQFTAGDASGFGALTGWGQGVSVSQFSSAGPGLGLSGEVATGSMGMDWERGRLLTGFAMTHSLGEGTAEGAGRSYVMGSSVTTMLPYARLALSERVSAWGLAGTGSGRLTLGLDGGAAERRFGADLAMTLAALGMRGELVTPAEAGGFALALKADGFWVRTESESMGNLAGVRADASRLRAVLDGSRTFALAGGGTLTPSVELGLRQDGGDAETGTGMVLGAGLGWADPSRGLDMALRVQGLAAHAGDDYREWSVSGRLRLVPGGSGRGLSASLTPSHGVDPGGGERLWTLPDASALAANGDAPPSSRLDGELGYGMAVFGGSFTGTPHVGFGLSDTARELRMGWRLSPAGGGGFEFSLDAIRREAVNDNGARSRAGSPEHRVGFGFTARW